jgi:hypothetical protein
MYLTLCHLRRGLCVEGRTSSHTSGLLCRMSALADALPALPRRGPGGGAGGDSIERRGRRQSQSASASRVDGLGWRGCRTPTAISMGALLPPSSLPQPDETNAPAPAIPLNSLGPELSHYGPTGRAVPVDRLTADAPGVAVQWELPL